MENVLVTGGTGFLAGWVIRYLLEQNYDVRTTVRSEKKVESVKKMLSAEGIDVSHLSFAFADLTKSEGWDKAMEGIDFVIHTASPLGGSNMDDSALISVAVSGVENVVKATIKAKVKKIVMTSSEAANYPDKNETNPSLDETF